MQKDEKQKTKSTLSDWSPVILGEIGAVLLVLPFFAQMSVEQERKMFIASLALMAYAGISGTVGLIAKRKNASNTKTR